LTGSGPKPTGISVVSMPPSVRNIRSESRVAVTGGSASSVSK
jgi:hypothetical protein